MAGHRTKHTLSSTTYAVISQAIERKGHDRLAEKFQQVCPDRNRNSCRAILKAVAKGANTSYMTTTIASLGRLARALSGEPGTLPFGASSPPVAPKPLAAAPMMQQPARNSGLDTAALAQVVAQAVVAGISAMTSSQAPQLTSGQPSHETEQSPPVESPIRTKQFPELSQGTQVGILTRMHCNFADRVSEQSGLPRNRALGLVWDESYKEYEEKTGIKIRDIASGISDSGERTRPLEIIRQRDDLVRFWRIVCAKWQVDNRSK